MTRSPQTLLLTRPERQSQRFAGLMRDRVGPGLRIVISPLIRVDSLGLSPDFAAWGGVIFTSENAVLAVPRPPGGGVRAFCVGDRTARAACEAGFDAVSASGTASSLVDLVMARRPQGPLLHLRGEHVRRDLAMGLSDGGIETGELIVYRQVAQPLSNTALTVLSEPGKVIVPLFSPRSAALFAATPGNPKASVCVVAMSEAVASAIAPHEKCADVTIAKAPTSAAMLTATMRALARRSALEGKGPAG